MHPKAAFMDKFHAALVTLRKQVNDCVNQKFKNYVYKSVDIVSYLIKLFSRLKKIETENQNNFQ